MSDPTPGLELTILLPCLNEARTLPTCLQEARAALARHGIAGEIIVADNGSTDGSRELAAAHGARVVPVAERGYGAALRGGIAAAQGRFILMGDADASYDFGELDRFVAALRGGADLVMGNRFRGGIRPGAMPWKNRYIGNPVLSFLGRLLFGGGTGDFHCGLRAFRADAIRRLDLRTSGMEFASEMVIKARLAGLRTTEVPATLRKDGRDRPPHLRPWRDGWRHLRFMLLFSPRWLFLYPGLLLIAGGGLVGARLVAGPWRIADRVTLDVHTLLFCAVAVLVGTQAALFAVLAKAISHRFGLRPPDAGLERWLGRFSVENGLITGGLLALVGFALSAFAVFFWGRQGFHDLTPQQVLRWVIPGGALLTLGAQVALHSCLLGVLGLAVQPRSE